MRKAYLTIFCLVFLIMPIYSFGDGVHRYLDKTDAGCNDSGSAEAGQSPWCTINYAISHLEDGDTLHISGGTYTLTALLDIQDNNITLVGSVDLENNPTTIIDGSNAYQVLKCEGKTVTLQNIVIRNGTATDGGGIYCVKKDTTASDLTLANCRVLNNNATGKGGGIYCSDSTIRIINSTIENNTLGEGGEGKDVYFKNCDTKAVKATWDNGVENK